MQFVLQKNNKKKTTPSVDVPVENELELGYLTRVLFSRFFTCV